MRQTHGTTLSVSVSISIISDLASVFDFASLAILASI